MKEKKRIRSMTAVTLALSLSFFLTWLVSMFCITNAVAQDFYDDMIDQAGSLNYNALFFRFSDASCDWDNALEIPGYWEYCMLDSISRTQSRNFYPGDGVDGSFNVLRGKGSPMQTAVTFWDEEGNLLFTSGNYMYFPYDTQEIWDAGLAESNISGYAWIDLGLDVVENAPFTNFQTEEEIIAHRNSGWKHLVAVMRVTGHLDGAELIPAKIEYVSYDDVDNAVDQIEPDYSIEYEDGTLETGYSFTTSELDHKGLLDWQVAFDNTDEMDNPENLVTVYTDDCNFTYYDAGDAVTYDGETYDDLLALLSDLPLSKEYYSGIYMSDFDVYSLTESILFDRDAVFPTFADGSTGKQTILTSAVSFHPLRAAMTNLRNVYIVTFLLCTVCVLLLRKLIKRNLVEPVKRVNVGISEGWSNLYYGHEEPAKWQEPYALSEHYNDTRQTLRYHKNEITRLNSSLAYAKNAEENRRQMVSAIAHELKTPLAVIHSYAEGLKEHIAEEKRDKYLDVILSESDRVDAMVLELLDLSRLEAGKVKLAQDTFSLAELTQGVFDRLEMAIAAKELTVSLDFPEHSIMTADEGRIHQVIENFATNAVKYTPAGGSVRVRIRTNRFRSVDQRVTEFFIENDSEPLSPETLGKVWDTFYRADNARSGGGTGLGLAIAKNIVELHGGTCSVRNTKTGVEFQFAI